MFVTNRIPLLDAKDEEVVLIRTKPVSYETFYEGREGRHIISRNKEGLRFSWLAETNVQEMLAAAGVTELPPPEPWPPVTNNLESSANQTTQTPEPRPSERRFSKTPRGSGSERATDASSASSQVAETVASKSWLPILIILLCGAGLAFSLWRKSKIEK